LGPRRRRFKSCRSDHSLPIENEDSGDYQAENDGNARTDSAQNQGGLADAASGSGKMKFPVKVSYRKAEVKIYGKSVAYPFYRLCYYAAGKRRIQSFATYTEAKAKADAKVRELASGSQSIALTAKEATAALSIRDSLDAFRRDTGRSFTALEAVTGFLDAMKQLPQGCGLTESVREFGRTLAIVKRKDISEAADQFIDARKPRTEARDGKRPQLSPGYAYNVAMWLREFAKTFPGNAVCDLTREHLDLYFGKHSKVSPKTRNERRNVVRMFLKWCVRQDYLRADNRLLEADCMVREVAEPEEIAFYTPTELRAMLENAHAQLRPVIALIALGGVRLQEAVRLTWEDIFHVEGHVEISSGKSKTRSRRLVTICPALAGWLDPYRNQSGPIWTVCLDKFHSDFNALRDSIHTAARRNGLRHGFCTYHYALHADEGLTAKEAGNSPAMIHKCYKGMVTRADAEKWFNVQPHRAANIVPLTAKTAANP